MLAIGLRCLSPMQAVSDCVVRVRNQGQVSFPNLRSGILAQQEGGTARAALVRPGGTFARHEYGQGRENGIRDGQGEAFIQDLPTLESNR